MIKICELCNKSFTTRKKGRRYCSKECFGLSNRGEFSPHYKPGREKPCAHCGVLFRPYHGAKRQEKQIYCSRVCADTDRIGERNPGWKNGCINSSGYRVVRINNVLHYEHRLIAEKAIGRPLSPKEVVHHLDGNPQNNDPTNLVITTQASHMVFHRHQLRKSKMIKTGTHKQCTICLALKPFSEFHKDKNSPDLLVTRCKECTNNRAREQRKIKHLLSLPVHD